MATRKPAKSTPTKIRTASTADAGTPSKSAPRKRAAKKVGSTARRAPAEKRATRAPKPSAAPAAEAKPGATEARAKRPSAGERERRFNLIIQTACLKAGTAAAIATITAKVPLLGRFAPVVLGSVGETLVLAKIQQQLVRDTIELYAVQLSDAEEEGVILLATAVNIGAQQISKTDVEALIEQLSGRLYKPLIARVLPLASVSTEVAAAVASTYAVGKRAQALCRLPGTGARDLSDLLRSLSGIDKARLYTWTADAFAVALKPFRGVLLQMLPGLAGLGRRR